MSTQLPEYTKDPVFDALLTLCRQAGIRVFFVPLPNHFYARSRLDDSTIQMPLDDRFQTGEHASIVLGHELAHMLVNAQYPAPPDEDTPHPLHRHVLIEGECDRLGSYFFLLAQRIADAKAAAEAKAAEMPEKT